MDSTTEKRPRGRPKKKPLAIPKKWTAAEYAKCEADLPYWLENWTTVMSKGDWGSSAKLVPFKLNEAQWMVHNALERQLSENGNARLIIVKGRQLGCTTYVAGRMLHKLLFAGKPLETAFMSHDERSMGELREQRYVDFYNRLERAKPMSGEQRIKRIPTFKGDFEGKLRMTYASGSDQLRGSSIELLHLSEAAKYDHIVAEGGDKVAAAAMESVAEGQGTEIIIESTAIGATGSFYKWIKGSRILEEGSVIQGSEENGFETIFLRTSLDRSYELHPLPRDFTMSKKEEIYARQHRLDRHHMAWRRRKIAKIGAEQMVWEYPETLDEALATAKTGSYIDPVLLHKATASLAPHGGMTLPDAPVILGVDVGQVRDRTVVAIRQGHVGLGFCEVSGTSFDRQAAEIARIFNENRGTFLMVDAGGVGYELCNVLSGYVGSRCLPVLPGGKPDDDARYAFRRDEMWGRFGEWIAMEEPEPVIYCRDDERRDLLLDDVLNHLYDHDAHNRLKMLDKRAIRKRLGGRSTDTADAFVLTFGHIPSIRRREDSDDFTVAPMSQRAVPSFSYDRNGGYGNAGKFRYAR